MKINIVNYEELYGLNGILSKYAYSLCRELVEMGHEVKVLPHCLARCDVNHHINYLAYSPSPVLDTLMITHLTGDRNQSREFKLDHLTQSLKTSHGITMSHNLIHILEAEGIDPAKLDYVLPAHDGVPRRPREIAILTDIKPDGRKREGMYFELFKAIDPKKFSFWIMGEGWQPHIFRMEAMGLQFKYFSRFQFDIYWHILSKADFVLYVGDEDCASQSLVDAAQAGVKTIAPAMPTNYEMGGVAYPFYDQDDLNAIFRMLEYNPVENWTWRRYAEGMVTIWERLLS